MDLEKEIKQAGTTFEEANKVSNDLYSQKEELMKKIHIFNVLCFSRAMAEFLIDKDIKSYNVSAINVRHYRDYESGENNIMFDIVDLQGKALESDNMDEKQSDIWIKCMDFFNSNALSSIDRDFINQNFEVDVWRSISLLKDTEEQILDLFLNKDLRTILEFNKMKVGLENSNVSCKKAKL